MNLPRLNSRKNKTKKYTYVFGGINRQESYSAGEIETSENVSFDFFPAISAGREKTAPKASFNDSYEYIPVVGGAVVYKYEEGKGLTLSFLEEKEGAVLNRITVLPDAKEGVRYAARAGKYVVIFPDKIYFDVSEKIWVGFSRMEKVLEVDYKTNFLYLYSDRIRCRDYKDYSLFINAFEVGDVITMNGIWYEGNDVGGRIKNQKLIIREFNEDTYCIVFDPNVFGAGLSSVDLGTSTFKREVPDLKNLTSFGGRVWGNDANGKIYASKYNNPLNFEYFDLSSADSYTLETETTGEFITSYAMSDHVAFFKEDKIHRITGTKPSNFRHSVVSTNGVKKGAEKTLALKDGILYYMGTDGVYTYGGAEAQKISQPLSDLNFTSGAGVFYKDTYYISINDGTLSTLYGYDRNKKMWIEEGKEEFKNAFIFLGESLFADASGKIKKIADGKDLSRDMSVTFRDFKESDAEQKGWSRLYIVARLGEGARLKAEVDYGFGFETVGVFTDRKKTVFEIRLKPNRGDKLSLRLSASPDTVITKIMREHYVHNSVF